MSRLPAIGLLVLVAFAGTRSLWLTARSSAGIDFYQMWMGARAASGAPDFYSVAARERIAAEYLERARTEERSARRLAVARYRQKLETLSTPLLYTMFAVLRGTYESDLLWFQSLMFLSFACWVGVMTRTYRYGLVLALALYCFLVFVFAPVRSDFRVVNLNHFVLLLIAAASWSTYRRHYAVAGSLLAFATLLKPYTILVFPLIYAFWLLQKRWRDLRAHMAGAVITAIAAILASGIHFGSMRIWIRWLNDFRAMSPEIVTLELGNFAFTRLVEDLSGIDVSMVMLVMLGGAAVALARTSASPVHSDLLAIGLGCVLFQFVSPLVWVHHLLLSVPLVAYLLRPAGADESPARARSRQSAALLAFALTTVEPWSAIFPAVIQVAAVSNVGLLVAYVAGLRDLRE